MRFLLIIIIGSCGVLLGAAGCEEPGVSSPDASTDSGASIDAGAPPSDAPPPDARPDPPIDAGPDAPPPPPEDAGPPPSDEFVALYDTVIAPHCGGGGCHGPGGRESSYFGYTPALQMPDPTRARAVLVGRRVECMYSGDDRIRVVPFDPAASAIMTVAEDGLCGRRHNIVVPDFTSEDLAAIETWIANGAR